MKPLIYKKCDYAAYGYIAGYLILKVVVGILGR